ncbi:MAG: GGDEF domain-containing protein, partial [Burkholderiaceae bacterium]
MNNDPSDTAEPGHDSGPPGGAPAPDRLLPQRDRHALPKASDGAQAARLMEVNQRLVVAALQSQAVAEKATERLDDITHESQHDALTGLPARALLKDRLGRALGMAHRHDAQAAVMFIDVDRFKHINDTFGHTVGDEALKLVAQRLESVVRHSDTVSRHGGDEFVVLLAEISQHSDAAHIARKMRDAVAAACLPVEQALALTVSIGIAIYPGDGLDAESLIANADTAMYRSKKAGGDQFHFYNPAIDEAESEWIGETRPLPLVDQSLTQSLSDKYNDLLQANEHLLIATAG